MSYETTPLKESSQLCQDCGHFCLPLVLPHGYKIGATLYKRHHNIIFQTKSEGK